MILEWILTYREMRWKNGGGITHEIAREDCEPPGWRLSVATIHEDGHFSAFPEYDRSILALDEAGVHLNIDGTEHALTINVPLKFRGESSTKAIVEHPPARDFNVMTQRTRFSHQLEIIDLRHVTWLDLGERCFIYVPGGRTLQTLGFGRLEARSAFGPIQVCLVRIRAITPPGS